MTNVEMGVDDRRFQFRSGHVSHGTYPGDDYVDYISIDGYNWGTAQSWSGLEVFFPGFFRGLQCSRT